MSLGVRVTLGYPKMVYSQVFRVYRHMMYRRLVHNARKSSNPVLWNTLLKMKIRGGPGWLAPPVLCGMADLPKSKSADIS